MRARKIVVNARTSKMMITMTLAVPNKIRARSRRLRHVVHEQGEPSFFVGGGVVVAHSSSLDGALV